MGRTLALALRAGVRPARGSRSRLGRAGIWRAGYPCRDPPQRPDAGQDGQYVHPPSAGGRPAAAPRPQSRRGGIHAPPHRPGRQGHGALRRVLHLRPCLCPADAMHLRVGLGPSLRRRGHLATGDAAHSSRRPVGGLLRHHCGAGSPRRTADGGMRRRAPHRRRAHAGPAHRRSRRRPGLDKIIRRGRGAKQSSIWSFSIHACGGPTATAGSRSIT